MKNILLLFAVISGIFFQANETYGQNTISYHYDAAGNRVERTIVLHASSTKSTQADTTSQTKEDVLEEKMGEQKVLIYPNPTKGQLLVEISGYDQEAASGLYLYNLSGTLLQSKSPVTGSDLLDLSAFPMGTYVLKIVLGNKKSEWKVVKTN
jgi:hypothetical protein